jgi:hypothetical protein
VNEPLDELYLQWLYSQVGSVKLKNPSRTHWKLLKQLYQKEIVWVIPNDDDRLADGRDLRIEFLHDAELNRPEDAWMEMGCSFLELLIALSRRLSFMAEGEPAGWFWEMIRNLGFDEYNDRLTYPNPDVDERLDQIIWRQYHHDGTGGIFPLERPDKDQRVTSIWYQMNAYVIELEERREIGLL